MNLKRTRAIAKKEFKHLIRDIRMLSILIFFPAFLLGIFGYAVNFDVQHIKIAVYDEDRSEISREFIKLLSMSSYFDLIGYAKNDSEIKHLLDKKIVQVVAVIPKDLSRKYYSRREAKIQYLVDGVDGNTASIIQMYCDAATIAFSQKLTSDVIALNGLKAYMPVDLELRFWFNPDLKSTRFLIPGLISMILLLTAAVSVSLSLVREKEKGTIEQINVSSIKTLELLIGKTTPYVVLAFIDSGIILLVGYILFGIVVKGNFLLLFMSIFVFLVASTSIGILVSVVSESQQLAFAIATSLTMLPSMILSGFIFPIESMPPVIQFFTNITPAKFFINILRAIILRGVGIRGFWDQLIYLLLFASILLSTAIIIFNRQAKKV
jgi:ABC-2 type transport system permease protein